ncbi:MAG TPA: response regulator transcription factor [Prolixibacteraceae bacterium]|jgi:DNA-binding response OmpR family regulator|nr:response regulator transcription factor [Prolixibacteraceae bacterium]HOS00707.1 response regulator transcription factor [Prolixibacteraceae bacterium]HOS90343.1 response regulator transcription factor [Prolixibacteraceae bacterium]HPL44860.1 response regulator transcription factor [Prolixibacteraceae bacterium]HQE52464.1 response regulator transcription factor [Prolixibacteraceae bacterium]
MKILVIEDHPGLLSAIVEALEAEKFLCERAADFGTAEEKIHLYRYDLIIVDINLPGGSGLEIIREVKRLGGETGIIVVSARDALDNKIEGLELGADDYVTKPFDMAELVARVKALVRRRNFGGQSVVTQGDFSIDTQSREVTAAGRKIDLTRSEYDILLFLFSNAGRVISRESLAEHIWGDHMDLADSFDFIYSHIKNLRKKITTAGATDPIRAVYGIGYKYEISRES